MRYLIAFLVSLLILAVAPAYADDEGCVTVEKFVEQNKPQGVRVEWFKVLEPQQIAPIREALAVPEDANITEIRLFDAKSLKHPEGEAGIAFGHDNLVCVWATLTPAAVALVLHILEVTKRQEI